MSDEQIKYMRDRFLGWTLPYDLNPDGGISYKRSESAIKYNHPGPAGTNFLNAEQAEAMVRYMIDGMHVAAPQLTRQQALAAVNRYNAAIWHPEQSNYKEAADALLRELGVED